jgi:hypothetical protein
MRVARDEMRESRAENERLRERLRRQGSAPAEGSAERDALREQNESLRRELEQALDALGREANRRSEDFEAVDTQLTSTIAKYRKQKRRWAEEQARLQEELRKAAAAADEQHLDRDERLAAARDEQVQVQHAAEDMLRKSALQIQERDEELLRWRAECKKLEHEVDKASALLARTEKDRLLLRVDLTSERARAEQAATQLGQAEHRLVEMASRLRDLGDAHKRAGVLAEQKAAAERELTQAKGHMEVMLAGAQREAADRKGKLLAADAEAVRLRQALADAEVAAAEKATAFGKQEFKLEAATRDRVAGVEAKLAEAKRVAAEAARRAASELSQLQSDHAAALANHREAAAAEVAAAAARAKADRDRAVAEAEAAGRARRGGKVIFTRPTNEIYRDA